MQPSAKTRQDEILAEAIAGDQYLPGGPVNRHDCKVLVKRGLLEPNEGKGWGLGYRPTPKGRAYGEARLSDRIEWHRANDGSLADSDQ